MDLVSKRWAVLYLCAVFAFCFYRAAVQSFTIDESYTFLRYVDAPFGQAVSEYSSNNHVLQSLLMRAFRGILGRSELVLRIPSLIGCALFLTASYRITRDAIQRPWARALALLLMTLNPLVLDFLVAARGYSLALGLSWWSFHLLWSDWKSPSRWGLWAGGASAGLAISANLIFVIPLAMSGLLWIPFYVRRQRFWDLIDSYAGPAIIISFTLLVIPLSKGAGQFYYGVKTLSETIGSLLGESLRQPWGGTALFAMLDRQIPDPMGLLIGWVVPVLFFASALGAAWLLARSLKHPGDDTALLGGVVFGTMALSVGCWVLMHRYLGFVYPLNRTALYMLPLAGFGCALIAGNARPRILSLPLGVAGVLVGLLYVTELRTNYFGEWRGEAGMKTLLQRLKEDARDLHRTREVTAAGTWFLEYSVRYYRVRYRMGWLRVLDVNERKTVKPDYYVLAAEENKLIDELHLKVIAKDDFSGTVLARGS